MHHANVYYGHADVMARYCGIDLDPAPRIQGYLQHGWNIGDGLAPGTPYVAGSQLYVWSEKQRRRSWSLGYRNVVVVGAPWSYLLAMQPEPADQPEREGTIYYPFHGWEGQHVHGDHKRLIKQIREVEDGPVTICLYWNEYRMRRVRRIYENAGFRIVTHGYRGFWWRNTDRFFLDRQLAEIRRHKRVASNRLSSAVFYGTLAGCEPAVYGDTMTLANEDPTFGGVARQRRLWPEMHGAKLDLAAAQQTARAELGADRLLPPEAVRRLFGWSDEHVTFRNSLDEAERVTATESPMAGVMA
ncbi:hypothetical protein HDA40_003054 [Hamadaea flava]|uniref:Uncharacterized protein n=1 Tax=Hamadaea flava TaxID=1742688 RepID=A0ABV8LYG2_9ACTN|nr:hypothetical protein [Hamadaea flava]MCP2324547.1 hypothetical protein [Hamadaea flava]